MMDPSLALQTALRTRLIAFGGLMALVPASNVLDHSGPATRYPAIMLGEGQTVQLNDQIDRSTVRVFLDVHVWAKADDLGSVKTIAGAIRDALRNFSPCMIADHRLVDLYIQTTRFMRDRQSETPLAHAVVSINALLQEIAP